MDDDSAIVTKETQFWTWWKRKWLWVDTFYDAVSPLIGADRSSAHVYCESRGTFYVLRLERMY